MISDDDAEKCLTWIWNNAEKFAQARANRIYLEEYRKTQKAILVQKCGGTVQERESFAYGHPDYIKLLEGLKVAVEEEEKLRWQLVAAEAKIETWRTQSANARRG